MISPLSPFSHPSAWITSGYGASWYSFVAILKMTNKKSWLCLNMLVANLNPSNILITRKLPRVYSCLRQIQLTQATTTSSSISMFECPKHIFPNLCHHSITFSAKKQLLFFFEHIHIFSIFFSIKSLILFLQQPPIKLYPRYFPIFFS